MQDVLSMFVLQLQLSLKLPSMDDDFSILIDCVPSMLHLLSGIDNIQFYPMNEVSLKPNPSALHLRPIINLLLLHHS